MKLLRVVFIFCCSISWSVHGDVALNQEKSDAINKTSAAPIPVVKKEQGKDTYEQFCVVCHKDGLAGAPRFRNEEDWQPRLAKKKIEDLLRSSKTGLNAMPMKGSCIQCSDEDLKAAITYMLPK